MCDCIYCRQEPDYPREQHEQANSFVDWERAARDATTAANDYLKERDKARYQIERAIAQLETANIEDLQEPSAALIDSVVAQLTAFLEA